MPQSLASQYITKLREAQEECCGACGSWYGLRPWSAEEVYCRACLAIGTLKLDGGVIFCSWESPLRIP